MTIKQQGGIFGRNPTFNDVDIDTSLNLGDGVKLNFGAGDDLVIQHQGSYSIIEDKGTGNLLVKATNLQLKSYQTNEMYIEMIQNGAVDLYHNGVKQAYTSSVGLAFPSGKGIDFSATSGTGTSELFDDYEEGEVNLSTTDANVDIKGNYVKAGRMVTVTIAINPSSGDTSWATGDTITGLPYAAATTSSAAGGSYNGGQYYGGYMMTTTTMRGRFYVSGTSLTIIDGFGTSTNYSASFTYISET